MPRIELLVVQPTPFCNIDCRYCYLPDRNSKAVVARETLCNLFSQVFASGWTGLYHPIWHADDKWSKCWQNLRVTASLSTGEVLDSSIPPPFELFFLEDENPVGQGNASLFMVWVPVLRFGADLTDLRTRGVSIILKAELRYDYQLEGESDLWLRHRPGSDAESVAAFDNAVTFQVFPGSVLSV